MQLSGGISGIAMFRQQLRKGYLPRPDLPPVFLGARNLVRVVSRDHAGPGRHTNGARSKRVAEANSFGRHGVIVRRKDVVIPSAGQCVTSHLVGDEKNDIGEFQRAQSILLTQEAARVRLLHTCAKRRLKALS